jgi:hypothetical protein
MQPTATAPAKHKNPRRVDIAISELLSKRELTFGNKEH